MTLGDVPPQASSAVRERVNDGPPQEDAPAQEALPTLVPSAASPPAPPPPPPPSRLQWDQQHFSVIQSTGRLLAQPPSPQHRPLALCSSPKPLAVPPPPSSAPSTSPRALGAGPQTSTLKTLPLAAAKASRRKQLETSLAQINEFRLKQVRSS